MHELSIALSIIEGAQSEAELQGGGRVAGVYVRLGPLSGVVRESLVFAYEVACEGTPLQGSKLIFQESAVQIFCPDCGEARPPVSARQLHCSVCGAPAREVVSGAELELVALELES
jgi:hydrogenase nickel incorporation protein HypA/HybF